MQGIACDGLLNLSQQRLRIADEEIAYVQRTPLFDIN
jgi:hypothetical protein